MSATHEPHFSAQMLELKLKRTRLVNPVESLPTPPSSNSSGNTSPPVDRYEESYFLRPFEDCIAIYEDASRSKADSLDLLSDEEVIMLVDRGKIAPYALEKMFGMGELERAVRIRRAVVCKSHITL